MSVADGENRITVCHREVSGTPSFSTSTLTTRLSTAEHVASYTQTIYVSQLSNPISWNNYRRIAERTHTILQIQQSACKPRQTPSYGVPPEEQRSEENVKCDMEQDRSGEHTPSYISTYALRWTELSPTNNTSITQR